jgi:hypothetical protein
MIWHNVRHNTVTQYKYKGVSEKRTWTCCQDQQWQVVVLSATRCHGTIFVVPSVWYVLHTYPPYCLSTDVYSCVCSVWYEISYWLLWKINAFVLFHSQEMQETKSGFPVITQKPNSSSFNGKAHHCHVHKKQGKSDQSSRGCWWLILTGGWTLIIRNLFHQARQLTTITTGRVCNVCGGKPAENIWRDGRTRTGWFATTMCLHTTSELQYLVCKNRNVVNYPPSLSDLIPYGFFSILRMKSQPCSASRSGTNSEVDYFEGDNDNK